MSCQFFVIKRPSRNEDNVYDVRKSEWILSAKCRRRLWL